MSASIYRTEDPALEVSFVPVEEEEETASDSYALLYRFIWPC